ncbi:hypothetical protein ACH5RR_027373 [Cinchona calisaya]|uniref:Uncharacterized protein n=1 Tax=Cinchona calisaya TaxID=153742 RepID=A0ABD2Z5B2_9GENT
MCLLHFLSYHDIYKNLDKNIRVKANIPAILRSTASSVMHLFTNTRNGGVPGFINTIAETNMRDSTDAIRLTDAMLPLTLSFMRGVAIDIKTCARVQPATKTKDSPSTEQRSHISR